MKTRTLEQTVTFKAPPLEVYEMIMDSRRHQSLSGEKARISRKVGGSFTAWGAHSKYPPAEPGALGRGPLKAACWGR